MDFGSDYHGDGLAESALRHPRPEQECRLHRRRGILACSRNRREYRHIHLNQCSPTSKPPSSAARAACRALSGAPRREDPFLVSYVPGSRTRTTSLLWPDRLGRYICQRWREWRALTKPSFWYYW